MKTEQIERYLTRQMTDEERAAFEQEMREQPQLAEDVKIVAWTIEAIRERGKQEDEEAIKRMREEMGSDNKRYYATVAAVIGGVLIVAAMTAVSIPPLYKHVIKPIIESVFPTEEKSEISNPQQPSSLNTPSLDSIASSSDTNSINNVGDDTQGEDQKVANEPQKQEDEPAKEENVKEEPLKEEKAKEDKENKEEATIHDKLTAKEKTKTESDNAVATSPDPVKITKVNKVESVEGLKDYKVTLKKVTRVGSNVVCIIEMTNTEEDAKVKITNARAETIDGTYFGPGVCKINGKDSNKEIKEKWKKGETHQLELTVEGVSPSITAFEKVSFLFESEGKNNPQKRKTIRLKAGDIR